MSDYEIRALRFPSFYVKAFDEAVAFYTKIFGETEFEEQGLKGWKLGDTWITLFSSAKGEVPAIGENPSNAEFAVEVAAPEQVDALHAALVAEGATSCMAPKDTWMYEDMRFCAVDDPFGIRVDVYCPLNKKD